MSLIVSNSFTDTCAKWTDHPLKNEKFQAAKDKSDPIKKQAFFKKNINQNPRNVLVEKGAQYSSQNKDEAKQQAARCIQKAWRRHRAPVNLLRNPDLISSIPHRAIKLFTRHLDKASKEKRQNIQYNKDFELAIDSAQRIRKCQKELTPVFISVGQAKKGVLPTCTLTQNIKNSNMKLQNGIYLTKEAQQEFQKIQKYIPASKKELDDLVQALRKEDVFPWGYADDGCYARANIMIEYLRLMGIPESNLFKHYVVTSSLSIEDDEGNDISWRYHVAPLIRLADGTEWVIDPSLDKLHVLSKSEWVQKQNPQEKRRDLGMQNKARFDYPKDECVSFTTNYNLQMDNLNDCLGQVSQSAITSDTMKQQVQVLADYRQELEDRYLNSLRNSPI